MEQQIMTTMSYQDILNIVKEGVREVEKEKLNQVSQLESFSIAGAAKELGRSHSTVKKLIMEGRLKTTADGRRIPAHVLNSYMKETG